MSALEGLRRAIAVQGWLSEAQGLKPSFLEGLLEAHQGVEWTSRSCKPITAVLDAQGVITAVSSDVVAATEAKKRKRDIFAFKEMIRVGVLNPLVFTPGPNNPSDPLTKSKKLTTGTQPLLQKVIAGEWREFG